MAFADLQFGVSSQYRWEIPPECQVTTLGGSEETINLAAETRQALLQPLEIPPLLSAVVAGDKVVLATERGGPLLDPVIAALWETLSGAGVQAEDLLILQPAALGPQNRHDPRSLLPAEIRNAVQWKIHDPTAPEACGYLATSAAGERIYLARELLDADVVIPVGVAGFDPIQGYKSACGVLFPGLSTPEAFKKMHGLGHQELRPEDERPIRQLIDETGWLLGVMYVVQVLPSRRRGEAAKVAVGTIDAVGRSMRKDLDGDWRGVLPERVETVVATIPTQDQPATWEQLGQALQAAKNLVARGGRIVVLSDLTSEPGPGVALIREHRTPRAAIQPLRALAPGDLLSATQLASAADWAQVYLLTQLDPNLIEELHCIPLEQPQEMERLLSMAEECVLIPAAQFLLGEIQTT